MQSPLALATTLTALLAFGACSGSSDALGTTDATADVLIGDAPADELLSFTARIDSLRFQRQDGTFGDDLIGSLAVDFLDLDAFVFLPRATLPAGTYGAVEIGFAPGQYRARGRDGLPVDVVAATDTLLAELESPLVVGAGGYARCAVDLDLLRSISGDPAAGSIGFEPQGSAETGAVALEVEDLRGGVIGFDPAAGTVELEGTPGSLPVALPPLTVHVGPAARLFDEDEVELTLEAFFDSLFVGGTALDLDGQLGAGGTVEAARVELEPLSGGAGAVPVVLRGFVTAAGGSQLGLLIAAVDEGEIVAGPVLELLSDPGLIAVSFDAGTKLTSAAGGAADASALAVGRELEILFEDFDAPPFPAATIEIGGTPSFRGTLTGLAGLPQALVVNLDALDPAVRGGSVASTDTDVTVSLGEAQIVLGLPREPALEASELLLGLRLDSLGLLSGPPDEPLVTAERVVVRPGCLADALLLSVAAGGGNFVVDGGDLIDPFGQGIDPGPQLVWIEEGCTFEGDVGSAEEFQEVFGGEATPGATVDVRGLGNGEPNEIRAFALRVLTLEAGNRGGAGR